MPNSRPFAYNTGSQLSGTTQTGNIAVGVDDLDYASGYGGLQWWEGPDEDLGYIICEQVPSGTQPNPLGIPAYIGFYQSSALTENAFVELSNYIASPSGQTFSNGDDAKIWLNNNGYWTSYGDSTLLLYLDSGNLSSYPGTGSVWYDLSTYGNNSTLFNSPTYISQYSGILQFDDASLEYATAPNLGNLSQWTVEVWFRLSLPLVGKVASIVSNEFDLVNKLNFSVGTNNSPLNSNLAVGFYDGTWHSTAGFVPQTNVWYQVVGTYDGSVVRQYVNGNASGGTLNYVGTPQSGGETRIMRRWDSSLSSGNLVDGDLAIVKVYNIALSDSDVLNNYNTTYTRFLDSVTPTPSPTNTPTITPTNTSTNLPTLTPTSTTTPTNTETPTNTPTVTPTPTLTPQILTGGTFNLIDLPYTFPSSGNTIIQNGVIQTGSNNPNVIAQASAADIYWNTVDVNSVDTYSYFAQFTGSSVFATFSQNGDSIVLSASPTTLIYTVGSSGQTTFTFGVSPLSGRVNPLAVILQPASSLWNFGQPVDISFSLTNPISPTNTPTPTETPTTTPTNTETPTNTPTPEPTPTPTNTETPTNTPTPEPTPTPTNTESPTPTPSSTSAPACDISGNIIEPTPTPTQSPTVTPTNTTTPTLTPTNTPTPSPVWRFIIENSNTTRSVVNADINGNIQTLEQGSYPILNSSGYSTTHGTATGTNPDVLQFTFGGSGFFNTFQVFKNGILQFDLPGYASPSMVCGGMTIASNDIIKAVFS